ncbi:MAG: Allophanate hydrolase [Candidatus Celerinatantimonas neptuna]|nr:MAG: Allophanate hydrolase [Candidatus Celerinatantimonas neptuna]
MNTEMTIHAIHQAYLDQRITPEELLGHCLSLAKNDTHHAWIATISDAQLKGYLEQLKSHSPADKPLYGIPFAIKDNIDLAGLETTAACPDYAYEPGQNAFVVDRLIEAGAIPIGKTNLDQFATGLVGTRSPYGACQNSFDPNYISGGSSAGSAVAVASGQVCFALGTDTAGSGRVPASFNNILGLKGSLGRISCSGVVPACKSLDCVTLFATNSDDLTRIWPIAAQFDENDPFAREQPLAIHQPTGHFTFGVPDTKTLEFFGDHEASRLFESAIEHLKAIGGRPKPIDLTPFIDAAKLLYDGPWVAERLAGIQDFYKEHHQSCLPVIQTIIGNAARYSAVDAYQSLYQLRALKRQADRELAKVDVILTPTSGTIYTIDELNQEPIRFNSNLGFYTNFMNLLDYAAIALPAGFRSKGSKQGLPFGITLFSQSFSDPVLLALANRWEQQLKLPQGAMPSPQTTIDIAVCGAHLSGMALNHQLTDKGGELLSQTATAPCYRFYALADYPPRRPALIRDTSNGDSIDVEVWRLPAEHLAGFLSAIAPPLGLGKVELASGQWVTGFISEPCAVEGAKDITELKNWRNYIRTIE